jgi:Fe-Mn family superoxide dismutase
MAKFKNLGLDPIVLPYKDLKGLSKKLIADHYKLYLGYLERWDKIFPEIERFPGNGDKFEYQRLKAEEGFLRNAVILHELYFEQFTSGGRGDPQDLFGASTDEALDRLALLGSGSTGWAILALNLHDGHIFTFTMKEHSQGFVANSWPLLVLDTYEHSYMTDYGVKKDDYIAAFFKNVDWEVIARRMTEE